MTKLGYVLPTCVRCNTRPATRNAHRVFYGVDLARQPLVGGRVEQWQVVCDECFVVGEDDTPESPGFPPPFKFPEAV